jgi:hypothetical protein
VIDIPECVALPANYSRKRAKYEEVIKKIDIDYPTDGVIVECDPSLITQEEDKE